LSVTTILRSRWTGTLVAGVIALSVAILAALLLPGRAEAQEQATPKTTTKLVEPGDSLWTIAQAQLVPDAPQQVDEEVERLYALNRDRIGDDPNFLLVGQELFVGPALGEEQPRANGEEPATTTGATEPVEEPVAEEEPVEESVSAPVTEFMIVPATAEEPAAITEGNEEAATDTAPGIATDAASAAAAAAAEEEPAAEKGPSIEEGSSISGPEGVGGIAVDRKILGVGILSLTALIAMLIVVWRILVYRRPSSGWSLDHSQGYYHYYGENYAAGSYYANYAAQSRYQEEREKEEQATETKIFEPQEPDPNLEIPAASAGSAQTNSRPHRLGDGFDRRTDREPPKVLD
jgi:hypothetical protein